MSGKEIVLIIDKILFLAVLILFIIDLVFTAYLRSKEIKLKNLYYSYHFKIGYSLFTMLKITGVVFVLIFLLNPPLNAGRVSVIAITYIFLVLRLIVNYFEREPDELEEKNDT